LLLDAIEKTTKIIHPIIKEKKVKLLTQFDTDGLTATSIIIKMLIREDTNFESRVYKQLTEEIINNITIRKDDLLILTDFGSGQLNFLKDIIETNPVLILDHHEPLDFKHKNLFHINPMLFGEEALSSSIIAYLFAKALNNKNTDLIDLAIIGAVGDVVEEKWEFKGFAKQILEEAEEKHKISISKGLRLYGRNSRPIFQSLAYSTDPFIPGISGSESNAIQFLSELGISVKDDGNWRKMKDLSIDEQKKLTSAIIKERIGIDGVVEDIFGDNYTILGRPDELQDIRELSTLMNSCGRTDNSSVGIRLCLGDYSVLEESAKISVQYRKMISSGLNLIRDNKNLIKRTEVANYIIGEDNIPDTVIGTISSIVLNSNLVEAKPLIGLADSENGTVKVSARLPRTMNINIREVLVKAVEQIGSNSQAGGHMLAAGAFIPKGKEDEFIKIVDKILGDTIGNKES
jgi:single-stranded-DNA-specific exonuclease